MTYFPSLYEVIQRTHEAERQEMHTSIIGRVERYDAAKQTADVQPVIERHIGEDDDGRPVYERLPVIPNVPVMPLRGGGYHFHVPCAVGDFVLLVFGHASSAEWRESGEISQPVDLRRLSAGYPVAIPGVAPSSKPVSNASGTHATVGSDSGSDLITFTGGTVDIGKGASDFAALSAKVDANFTAVTTWMTQAAVVAAAATPPITLPPAASTPPTACTIARIK